MGSDEDGYQGWANYPTWAVNLWLANEEPLYRATVELAREAAEAAPDDDNVRDGIWTVEETARFRLADVLCEWVTEELAPDLGASFSADLLGWAFSNVKWSEIAAGWLEDAVYQSAAEIMEREG